RMSWPTEGVTSRARVAVGCGVPLSLRLLTCAFGIAVLAVLPAAVAAQSQTAAAANAGLNRSIVTDQFGYLPGGEKLAILRQPVVGFDRGGSYAPGSRVELVRVDTRKVVLTGHAVPWNDGAIDPSSGDRVWTFDFSAVR